MESKKIICYANLNSFNSPKGITNQHMRNFFEHYFEDGSPRRARNVEIIEVVVDHCLGERPLTRRPGWKRVMELCALQHVDCIVVPSAQMLDPSMVSLVDLSKELDCKYRTKLIFLLENITEVGEQFAHAIQFYATILSAQKFQRTNADSLRRMFYEATGLEGEASAVSVRVEYEIYDLADEVARRYGDGIDTLVRYLLQFAADPENADIVDEYIYGKDPSLFGDKRIFHVE